VALEESPCKGMGLSAAEKARIRALERAESAKRKASEAGPGPSSSGTEALKRARADPEPSGAPPDHEWGGLMDPLPRSVVEGLVGERLGLSREGVALTREELGLAGGVQGFMLSLMASNTKLGDPKKALAGFESKAMWLNTEARQKKREADEQGHFSLGRGHQEAMNRAERRLLAMNGHRKESHTQQKKKGHSELQELDRLAGQVLARHQVQLQQVQQPRSTSVAPHPTTDDTVSPPGEHGTRVDSGDTASHNPFDALHELWRVYAARLVSHPSEESLGDRMARMEWMGCRVEVARCKDAGHVGVRGIVALELKTAFALWVAPGERKPQWKRPLKVVPKRDTVFRVALPDLPKRRDGGLVRTDNATFSRIVLVDGNALVDRGPSGRGFKADKRGVKGKAAVPRPSLLLDG